MPYANANSFNVSNEWLSRIGRSLDRLKAGERDFRYANVGDSIATGEWGISSTSDHYAARASEIIAAALGTASRRGLITCGAIDTGPVKVDGFDWRRDSANGGLFGSDVYELESGGDAVLTFSPDAGASVIGIGFQGNAGLRYSLNGGTSWAEQPPSIARSADETTDACERLEVHCVGGAEIRLRAHEHGPATRVYFLDSADRANTAVRWFTSGIGASRTADLQAALSENNGRGFSSYGAAELDLLTIEIGVNNTIHADQVGVEESAAALRATVEEFIRHGVTNLALVGANPVRPDYQPGPWYVAEAYAEIYRPISLEFGIPLLEWAARWGNWERSNALGYIDDQVHPNKHGHQDVGAMVADLVLAAR